MTAIPSSLPFSVGDAACAVPDPDTAAHFSLKGDGSATGLALQLGQGHHPEGPPHTHFSGVGAFRAGLLGSSVLLPSALGEPGTGRREAEEGGGL